MKPLPILTFLIAFGGLFLGHAGATTKTLPQGPPAKVSKTVDDHLFHVYVTAPKAKADYSPGEVVIMLRKEYPDYLYVTLTHEVLADGRLKAQIAINPAKVVDYTVNILDKQPDGEYLMLYSKSLKEIEHVEEERAEHLLSPD
jgi:hypothetical protein